MPKGRDKSMEQLRNAKEFVELMRKIVGDDRVARDDTAICTVQSVNDDGTLNVYFENDKDHAITNVINQCRFDFEPGDNAVLYQIKNRPSDAFIVAKCRARKDETPLAQSGLTDAVGALEENAKNAVYTTDIKTLTVDGVVYSIIGSGTINIDGGTKVVANPSGETGTDILSTLKVGETVYNVLGGSSSGDVTSVRIQANGPLVSSNAQVQVGNVSTTIGIAKQTTNTFLAGNGTGAGDPSPSFRVLNSTDIPNLDGSKITGGTIQIPVGSSGAPITAVYAQSVHFGNSSSMDLVTVLTGLENTIAGKQASNTNLTTISNYYGHSSQDGILKVTGGTVGLGIIVPADFGSAIDSYKVFAGPTTGSAGQPSFRLLVADDMPIKLKQIEGLSINPSTSGFLALSRDDVNEYGAGLRFMKTLNTTNTTAQSTSSNESFWSANSNPGTINLHKVSKTGSYNDLLNKPIIPDAVSGTSSNDYWKTITIGGETHNIPSVAGGGSVNKIIKGNSIILNPLSGTGDVNVGLDPHIEVLNIAAKVDYNSTTPYRIGDKVKVGSTYYICTGVVQGNAPTGDTTDNIYWTYVSDAGGTAYDGSTPYVAGDTRTYSGHLYRCTGIVYGTTPPNSTYWTVTSVNGSQLDIDSDILRVSGDIHFGSSSTDLVTALAGKLTIITPTGGKSANIGDYNHSGALVFRFLGGGGNYEYYIGQITSNAVWLKRLDSQAEYYQARQGTNITFSQLISSDYLVEYQAKNTNLNTISSYNSTSQPNAGYLKWSGSGIVLNNNIENIFLPTPISLGGAISGTIPDTIDVRDRIIKGWPIAIYMPGTTSGDNNYGVFYFIGVTSDGLRQYQYSTVDSTVEMHINTQDWGYTFS